MKTTNLLAAIVLAIPLLTGCKSLSEPTIEPKAVSVLADPLMEGRSSTIIGVNYVGMTVSDLDRSEAFYSNSIDLKPVKADLLNKQISLPKVIAPEANLRNAAILKGPNSYLRLLEFEAHLPAHADGVMPVQGPGITHICFQAPKAHPIDGKFIAKGATWQTTSKAMVDMRGVGFMYGYLRDPDGLMLEVEHAPNPNFDVDYWMGHVAMATPDLTRTLNFYEKVLGFEKFRRVDNLSGATFSDVAGVENGVLHGAWFRIAPYYNLEFWEFASPKTQEKTSSTQMNQLGYSVIMLETTDIEADYKRIQSAGVGLATDIVPVFEGRAFYLRDLDGNLIGLTQFDNGSALSLQALK